MLYGLSRDDAGRFMPDYVAQGVFPHDPFHTLDLDGVGEIMTTALERARARRAGHLDRHLRRAWRRPAVDRVLRAHRL